MEVPAGISKELARLLVVESRIKAKQIFGKLRLKKLLFRLIVKQSLKVK